MDIGWNAGDPYLTEPKTSDDEEFGAYEEEHDLAACVELLVAYLLTSKN